MNKSRDKIKGFMHERNGVDGLYQFLMFSNLLLLIIYFLVDDIWKVILLVLITINIIYTYFRVFSKNISKRQIENQKFKKFFKNIARFFKIRYNKIKYRKVFYYKKCKKCKKLLRFKRIVGNHSAVCPSCGYKFQINIKR